MRRLRTRVPGTPERLTTGQTTVAREPAGAATGTTSRPSTSRSGSDRSTAARFVASQMPPATFDETTVDVTAGEYLFRVKGTVPKFPGWLATYGQAIEESESKDV